MRGKMHGKDQVQFNEFQLVRCLVTNFGKSLVVSRVPSREVQNSDFSDCVDAKK